MFKPAQNVHSDIHTLCSVCECLQTRSTLADGSASVACGPYLPRPPSWCPPLLQAKVEAANLAGACALERRVRGLEEAVASAGRQAAAGGVLARETSAALRALEWRVDQVGRQGAMACAYAWHVGGMEATMCSTLFC